MKSLLVEKYEKARKEARKEGIYFNNDTEGIRIERVMVNRVNLINHHPTVKRQLYEEHYLYVHFILEAEIQVQSPQTGMMVTMATNEIWQILGTTDYVHERNLISQEKKFTLIIPVKLLERWQKDGHLPTWLNHHNLKKEPIQQISLGSNHKKTMLLAKQLLLMDIDSLPDRLAFKSSALSICATILQQQHLTQGVDFTDDALSIIHKDPLVKWRLVDLAKQVGTNECYLKQAFKEKTGISIGRYMKNLRMKEAYNLIIHHNLSTKEAAYKVGYSDVSYFARIFKQQYGYTPSDLSLNK